MSAAATDPLVRRDELLAQLARAQRAEQEASRDALEHRNGAHKAEGDLRAAEVAELRGENDGPTPAELIAERDAHREALEDAQHRVDAAARTVRELERVIPAHYRDHAEAFIDEAEKATRAFTDARDDVVPQVRAALEPLARLEGAALARWRPLLAAMNLAGPQPTHLAGVRGTLGELARQSPRSLAIPGDGEAPAEDVEPPSGAVWMQTPTGQLHEVDAGSASYLHLVSKGAVVVDAPEVVA